MAEFAAARALDRLIWALVALVGAVVLLAPAVSDFRIAWGTFATPAGAAAALALGAWAYRRWRHDPKLASALENTAQLVAFAAVGAPLSYLAAASGLPLQDHVFDAMDRALGLDWMALLGVMNAQPVLYNLLGPIYLSLTLQMTTVVLCLAYTGRFVWLRVYMLAFIFAALATIAVSAVLPAAGVWPYYGLTAADSAHVYPAVADSWPVFFGLRDGSYRALVAIGAQGIITFPSLHAALAVIVIAALWPVAALRWVAAAVNAAMLAATPIDGSHYFIDIAAGLVVAAVSVWAARHAAMRAEVKRPPAAVPAREISRLVAGEQ
jgi:hypothetical protein